MGWSATLVIAALLAQPLPELSHPAKQNQAEQAHVFARGLLDQVAAEFREMETIVPPPSPFMSEIRFYKSPTASGVGLCSVDVMDVAVDEDAAAQSDQRLKPRSIHMERRYKLVGRGAPRDAQSEKQIAVTNELCRNLPTATDFFSAQGDYAIDGAEGFRRAIVQAQSPPLPFELTCSMATRAKCERTLKEMEPGRISSVRPCPSPSPGHLLCHTIIYDQPKMLNGQAGWSVDVIAQLGGPPKIVRMSQFNYPVS